MGANHSTSAIRPIHRSTTNHDCHIIRHVQLGEEDCRGHVHPDPTSHPTSHPTTHPTTCKIVSGNDEMENANVVVVPSLCDDMMKMMMSCRSYRDRGSDHQQGNPTTTTTTSSSGQLVGITMYNDKRTNNMNLIPMSQQQKLVLNKTTKSDSNNGNSSNKQETSTYSSSSSPSRSPSSTPTSSPTSLQKRMMLPLLKDEEPFFEDRSHNHSIDDVDDVDVDDDDDDDVNVEDDLEGEIIFEDYNDRSSCDDDSHNSRNSNSNSNPDVVCPDPSYSESKEPETDDTTDNNNATTAFESYLLKEGWKLTGQMDVLGGRLFLRRGGGRHHKKKNQLVAMVVRTLNKGYVVLGRQPFYHGQRPSQKHSIRIGNDDTKKKYMYEHAIIRKKLSLSLRSTWTIERPMMKPTANGRLQQEERYYHQYVATSCGGGSMFSGVSTYHRRNMIRVNEVLSGKPCALIQQYFANNDVLQSRYDLLLATTTTGGTTPTGGSSGTTTVVGTAADPCLMVCFVGILNKGMGKTVV